MADIVVCPSTGRWCGETCPGRHKGPNQCGTSPADAGSPSAGTCTCGIPMQHTGSCPAHRPDACEFCAVGAVPITEQHGTAPWRPAVPSPKDTVEQRRHEAAMREARELDEQEDELRAVSARLTTPPAVRTGEDNEADHFMNVDYTPRPERVGWPHSHTARPLVSGTTNRDAQLQADAKLRLDLANRDDVAHPKVTREQIMRVVSAWHSAVPAGNLNTLADELLALLGGDQ